MKESRPARPASHFTAPAWIMGGIVIFRILISVSSILTMRELQLRQGVAINKFALLSSFALVSVAIAEAVVYWRIRKKKYNRTKSRAHLLLMLISMVVLPLLFISFAQMGRFYLNSDHFVRLIRVFRTVQFYIFWICFITGTIFFISVVSNAFSPKTEQIEDMIDAIGDD